MFSFIAKLLKAINHSKTKWETKLINECGSTGTDWTIFDLFSESYLAEDFTFVQSLSHYKNYVLHTNINSSLDWDLWTYTFKSETLNKYEVATQSRVKFVLGLVMQCGNTQEGEPCWHACDKHRKWKFNLTSITFLKAANIMG